MEKTKLLLHKRKNT